MPFQKGNQHARLGHAKATETREWKSAIRRVALRNKAEQLNKAAEALVNAAAAGDLQALKEFGDRFEGKVPQNVEADIDAKLTVEIVRFASANSK